MALKIKGTEPKSIKVEENGVITELTSLEIYKNGELGCYWKKPYTLTISKGNHSTVTVGLKLAEYSMVIEELHNGSTINHGSYLAITVTGHQGYTVSWTLNGKTQSSNTATVPVTDNVVISVTETAAIQYLASPVISGTFSYDSSGGFYYLACQIKNNNSCGVTASIVTYADGDILEHSTSKFVPANSTVDYKRGEMYSDGAKVIVTFSTSGYGDSSASTTFGRYTSSGGSNDETTTTTS